MTESWDLLRPSSASGDPDDPAPLYMRVASMTLGGAHPNHKMSDPEERQMYEKKLTEQIAALFLNRHLVGLTGLNPVWYAWVRENVPHGKSSVHDGVDCALLWDPEQIEPVNPQDPKTVCRIYLDEELPEGSEPMKYNWRQFTAVTFKFLASPQVGRNRRDTRSFSAQALFELFFVQA